MPDLTPLEVSGLHLHYKTKPILDGLCLTLPPGQTVALAGLNGAGKTSLFSCILDFQRPQFGTICMLGIDHRRAESRRSLYYLPELPAVPSLLKGDEYLRLCLTPYGISWNLELAQRKAAELELDSAALKHSVRTYSKGMLQKLSLLGALLAGRSLLILDEPMSGLDPAARALLIHQLRLYRQEDPKRTLLFSTHLLNDVEDFCDRMLVLHAGRLLFDGKPEALLKQTGSKNLEQAFLTFVSQPA